MTSIIKISDQKPLFAGTSRAVYVHPDNKNLLIKIPLQKWIKKIYGYSTVKRLWKGLHTNSTNMGEYREFKKFKSPEDRAHILSIIELAQTDMGLGMVMEAECDENNGYGHSIAYYADKIDLYMEQIVDIISWVRHTRIVVHDMDMSNVVLSWRTGQPRLVLVDGFGESGLIKIRTLNQHRNRLKNNQEVRFFLKQLYGVTGKQEFLDMRGPEKTGYGK